MRDKFGFETRFDALRRVPRENREEKTDRRIRQGVLMGIVQIRDCMERRNEQQELSAYKDLQSLFSSMLKVHMMDLHTENGQIGYLLSMIEEPLEKRLNAKLSEEYLMYLAHLPVDELKEHALCQGMEMAADIVDDYLYALKTQDHLQSVCGKETEITAVTDAYALYGALAQSFVVSNADAAAGYLVGAMRQGAKELMALIKAGDPRRIIELSMAIAFLGVLSCARMDASEWRRIVGTAMHAMTPVFGEEIEDIHAVMNQLDEELCRARDMIKRKAKEAAQEDAQKIAEGVQKLNNLLNDMIEQDNMEEQRMQEMETEYEEEAEYE